MEFWQTIITALIPSGLVSLVSLLTLINQRKKDRTDNAEKIQAMTMKLIEPLQERIQDMQAENEEERDRRKHVEKRLELVEQNFKLAVDYVDILKSGVTKLVSQLQQHDIIPVWIPPAMPKFKDTGELKAHK